ncbi:hypothetical protein BN946_scf184988.g2 [Trametes cinnabarina]|uniref:RNase H type-1 domain-containing protein n=1 Tax=Pycnoporus cinnabarinus TaxID=5643 RepID=A0A060SKK0_PYCCI|nr:hypothetical protein BN946_scf184988.g2 [Trametes cinnabarina]
MTKTMRAGAVKNPAPSQEQLWTAAEEKVPSLGAAIDFLQKRRLIPEGSHAVTSEALITGLLHLAYLRPAHEFTAEGLIALAYVARAVAAEEAQKAVSRAVLERAEDQLTLRLDEHASHVETRVAELTQGVERMRREMETTVAELRDACSSVHRVEEQLGETHKSLAATVLSNPIPHPLGESATPVQSLTIDSAPIRIRRVATLADLLQRQVLVRDATLQDDLDNRLSNEQVCARARNAIDDMARVGLTPPGDGTVEEARVLAHGDIVLTAASREMAHWLLKPAVAKPFARKMGMTAQVVERTYKLVAERVPITFDPQDAATLRVVEEAHGLRPQAITRADWIKPVQRRHPAQRTAFIMLTIAGVEQANRAIRGLTLTGRKVLVRRDMEEPRRCTKCQRYDGHFARECTAEQDVCANSLQEPYLSFLGLTAATPHWRVVYPTPHGAEGVSRSQSLLLINRRLSTNAWNPILIPHPDITAVTIRAGDSTIHLFNLYVDGSQDTAIRAASRAGQRLVLGEAGEAHHHVWLGDFNRHHPAWDSPTNHHLFTTDNLERAEVLIEHLALFDLRQVLPAGIPTLEATRTKNLTRPDNVFASPGLLARMRSCVVERAKRPTKTDHFPICTTFDIPTEAAPMCPRRNFRAVDWEEFDSTLAKCLEAWAFPAHIDSRANFDTTLDHLMADLQATISEHVPEAASTPYTKQWWSKDLSRMRREKERLGRLDYRNRADPTHPSHAEYRRYRNMYADHIQAAKNDYWKAWIDSVDGKTIWDANRFLKRGASDGGGARIPPIWADEAGGRRRTLNSNEEKGAEFHRTFFLPPSTAVIPSGPYPAPCFAFKPITDTQVRRAIGTLRAFKAPGPDSIPNEVYKHCADTLTPVLGALFRATFTLHYYPDRWKLSDTVVLQKPGKTDYTIAKAWRPIALLDCMSKILSRCVAEVLVFEAEQCSLLANLQFGGRAGRTTSDSIHLVTKTVKDAWQRGDVASVVFLDIKSAFPAASPARLYHNLRLRGVPPEYVDWLKVKLAGRKTRLKFDDYVLDPFDILSGIDQGCPLSVILYAFYNSDLIDSADTADGEKAVGSMDDVALVVTGKTFTVCHNKVRRFMDRDGGVLDWSRAHNSGFSLDKFGLINCKSQPKRIGLGPPLTLSDGTVVHPSDHHRFLGVLMDQGLRFKQHVASVYAKGSRLVAQVRRLATARNGLALPIVRRLYLAVVIPSLMYAADTFLTPVRTLPGHTRAHGTVGHVRRLAIVQRQALLAMTGALRTAPTDALEAHAKVLPFDLLVDQVCHRAAVRLCTLPPNHPLAPHVQRAGGRFVKAHRSALHELLDAYHPWLNYKNTERIAATRLHPRWRPFHRVHILEDHEEAAADDHVWAQNGAYRVYTDGSNIDGGVGAAALLYAPGRAQPKVLQLYLGPSMHHTVYEAEIVATILGVELLRRETHCTQRASIALDNMAAIQASELRSTGPACYLTDLFHAAVRSLKADCTRLRLTLRWVPGHANIPGNEAADEAAKAAAAGDSSPVQQLPRSLRKGLPQSSSRLRQSFKTELEQCAAQRWRASHHGTRMADINGAMPSKAFDKLTADIPRRHANLLIQFRTNHVPLQSYLHRFGRADDATCPTCLQAPETIPHYLLDCPTYFLHRVVHFRPLGFSGRTLATLLNSREALRPLFTYVNATGRFRAVFGDLPDPCPDEAPA